MNNIISLSKNYHGLNKAVIKMTTDVLSILGTNECVHILHYLAVNDLLSIAQTSSTMYKLSRCNNLWKSYCDDELIELIDAIHTSTSLLGIISRKSFSESSSYERLEFLKGTCILLTKYATEHYKNHSWLNTSSYWMFYTLLKNVYRQVIATNQMLNDLSSGTFAITVNFDIYDIALRKYYEELSVIIPIAIQPIVSPAEHIKNILGESQSLLECWNKYFNEILAVPFNIFVKKIIVEWSPKDFADERCMRYLTHLFNFPRDNLFSVYRFKLLVTLFGPIGSVMINFRRFTLSNGFLGAINMIKAEEILTQLLPQMKRNTVLMRFSRRQPEFIAFSSIDIKTGKIEHRRNVNRDGKMVPIAQYIARAFSGYEIIHMSIDDIVTHFETTFTFAKYGGRTLRKNFAIS